MSAPLLKQLERDVIESVLQMERGFVLDFSNRTFAEFFEDFGLDIYDERYGPGDLSKANRLRTFFRTAPAETIGRVLDALLERRLLKSPVGLAYDDIERFRAVIARLARVSSRQNASGSQENTITEVTRRAIFDGLCLRENFVWCGRRDESAFLAEIFDLDTLRSNDLRFSTMAADHHQHRVLNLDWDDGWVYTDNRLNLLRGPDEIFLRFLERVVHPVARDDSSETAELVADFNRHLAADGWIFVAGPSVSGRRIFEPRRSLHPAVLFPQVHGELDVLSDVYVQELSTKCDARLAIGDLEGAITAARTMLEAILLELERLLTGTSGDHKGDLQHLYKAVAKQLRIEESRADLDDHFKQVARGLVQVVNGLAPIRNKMSDGHARQRKPAPHHARMVVNAAKTLATFLVESHVFQRGRVRPGDPPAS